eukprot:1664915-Prymnesium_polylepis.2
MGHIVEGSWEISGRAIGPALTHVLGELTAAQLVRLVPARLTGKADAHCIRNGYSRGEPFPRASHVARAKKAKAAKEEDEGGSEVRAAA